MASEGARRASDYGRSVILQIGIAKIGGVFYVKQNMGAVTWNICGRWRKKAKTCNKTKSIYTFRPI